MRLSSILGWSCGWVLASLFHALDVGADDPLFVPALVLSVPGLMGLAAVGVSFRKSDEKLHLGRVIGFGVLASVVATLAIVGIIVLFIEPHSLPPPTP
jgi:hypothetical protein